jgi:hypothetical protein
MFSDGTCFLYAGKTECDELLKRYGGEHDYLKYGKCQNDFHTCRQATLQVTYIRNSRTRYISRVTAQTLVAAPSSYPARPQNRALPSPKTSTFRNMSYRKYSNRINEDNARSEKRIIHYTSKGSNRNEYQEHFLGVKAAGA